MEHSTRRRLRGVALVVAMVLLAAACRSGSDGGDQAEAGSSSTTSTTAKAAAAGDFGDLKAVCGPGDAKGATDRGVTDSEIHVSTMGDPSNTAAPGLGQEFFDTADAFVQWCNDAGGILGRKLVLTKRDSKLFEVGARLVEACQSDFFLVGNGTPLDVAWLDSRSVASLTQLETGATRIVTQELGGFARDREGPADGVLIDGGNNDLRVLTAAGDLQVASGVGWQTRSGGIRFVASQQPN